MTSYTTKYKTGQCALVVFSYVLVIVRINSQVIYVINNAKGDVDSFKFRWELMKALVRPKGPSIK